jgi:hypothetical protein
MFQDRIEIKTIGMSLNMKHKVKGGERHGRHNYFKEGHVHHNPQVMHQILMTIIVQKIEAVETTLSFCILWACHSFLVFAHFTTKTHRDPCQGS